MKTTFLSIAAILLFSFAQGQDATDALRYSFLAGDGGTARNQALGGAGGSLGGEFTSLFLNPAGLGFFKTGDFVLTPSFRINSNEAEYLGNTALSKSNKMGVGATGVLFATEYRNRKIKSVTLGIGINNAANFNNATYYQGINKSTSYSQKFVEDFTSGGLPDEATANSGFPFGASQAFRTYLINPVENASGDVIGYSSLANPSYGLKQTMDKKTSGGITDIAIGVGANHQDRFFFGGTLSLPMLRYTRKATFSEDDASGNPANDFNYFDASEVLETKGVGANLKLGAIYKASTDFQVGLAFYTPTFFQMTDLYNMTITTDPEGYEGKDVSTSSSTDMNDGNYLRATYNMLTPLRAMLSGTYFISTGEQMTQQKGFITADIEFVNYRGTRFLDANNDESYKTYFKQLNGIIDDTYQPAVNFRLGGELKLSTLMLRLGGAYYGNPYSHESASYAKVTGGLGYRYRGFYVDLAYSYGIQNTIEYPYQLQNKRVEPALLTNNKHNVALTFGFKLY